ncbi:MAG: hotdog fold thioesterase [Flavipsychrobacter sp.]|nr:hotdog fold thioesterase [Flavipsychrobacter sp.]
MKARIWQERNVTIHDLNALSENTLINVLGISFIEIGDNFLKASMPVNATTHQPYGLLHGGASAALAETIGSVASAYCIDKETQMCVGIELNCNHLRGKKDGVVIATAEPLHIGNATHVWDIKIRDEKEKLICVSRLTVAILKKT